MGSCHSAPPEVKPQKDCIKSCHKIEHEASDSISDLSLDSISDLSKNIDKQNNMDIILPVSSRKVEIKKDKFIVVDDNLYYTHTLKPSLSFNVDIKSNMLNECSFDDDMNKQYKPISPKTPTTVCSSSSSISSLSHHNDNNQFITNKHRFLTQILTRNGYNGFPIFNGILSQVIDAMYKIELSTDEYLMELTKESNDVHNIDLKFFVIESGIFHLFQNGKKMDNFRLTKSSTFGEAHLVYNTPQISHLSIKATCDNCIVWALNRSSYYELSLNHFHQRFTNSITTKLSEFDMISTLGVGSFGTVYLVEDTNTKSTYSLKKLNKKKIMINNQEQYVINEKSVLCMISNDTNNSMNKFFSRLFATYQDDINIYFLMEPILGGELYSILRHNEKFSEKVARFYFSNILIAIDYLHSYNIIYRDIKPENIMISSNGYLKLIDFGLSKKRNDTMTYCGSHEYVAPEVISGYWQGFEMDYWGLGILLFEMITGKAPFETSQEILYSKIPDISNDGYSKFVLHLLTCLLVKNPSQRLGTISNNRKGIIEIYDHWWFVNEKDWNWNCIKQQTFKAPFIPHIEHDQDTSNFEDFGDDYEDSDNENGDNEEPFDDKSLYKWCQDF